MLDSFADRRPPAARGRPAAGGKKNRPLVLVAGGVGLAALIGMAIGLGYLITANARLEADIGR